MIGYDAAAGAENSEIAIMGLKYSYAILPAVLFVAAGLIVWNYPLSRQRQRRIRASIDRRDERRAAVAALGASGG